MNQCKERHSKSSFLSLRYYIANDNTKISLCATSTFFHRSSVKLTLKIVILVHKLLLVPLISYYVVVRVTNHSCQMKQLKMLQNSCGTPVFPLSKKNLNFYRSLCYRRSACAISTFIPPLMAVWPLLRGGHTT